MLEGQLRGVEPGDPATLLVTVLLGATGLVASWMPGRRAGRTDAMTVLREE